MKPDELITRIRWNLPEPEAVLKLYKVSKRKDLDISTFTAGILLRLKKGKIQNARLAFGAWDLLCCACQRQKSFCRVNLCSWKFSKKLENWLEMK